jgi:hypothetical protein
LQREGKLAASKQAAQKFNGERFILKNLNELEFRKITNRFAALENVSDGENINRAWENIKVKIKTSAKESLGLYELKQHKP